MKNLLNVCKALSDRNRIRIMAALYQHRELCGCQITELLQVSAATASRHLSTLQRSDLIHSRKEGRWIFFRKGDALERSGSLAEISSYLALEFKQSQELADDRVRLETIVAMDKTELCRRQRGAKCCQ